MIFAQLVHQLAYFPGIAVGDIADRFAAPVGVAGHHDALLRTRGGSCGVVTQRLVQFAFLLFGKAEVVQRERIAAIDGESLLQNHIGFRRAQNVKCQTLRALRTDARQSRERLDQARDRLDQDAHRAAVTPARGCAARP